MGKKKRKNSTDNILTSLSFFLSSFSFSFFPSSFFLLPSPLSPSPPLPSPLSPLPSLSGVYHGRIILPPEYPMKPPNIVILTPNGRFEVGTKICLSVSAHHPEEWKPSWGIRTILLALASFMPTKVGWGGGGRGRGRRRGRGKGKEQGRRRRRNLYF